MNCLTDSSQIGEWYAIFLYAILAITCVPFTSPHSDRIPHALTTLSLYKIDPIFTVVWFFSTVLVSWQHGSRCRDDARDITVATYTILLMVYVQYVLTVVLPVRGYA